MKELLLKAIAACDEYGHPVKHVYWQSANHPLGQTSFLRFHSNEVFEIKSNSGLVTGYSVNVWLNDCGHTYNTIWRFDYFGNNVPSKRLDILKQITGETT